LPSCESSLWCASSVPVTAAISLGGVRDLTLAEVAEDG
jgi:hypothetical protein